MFGVIALVFRKSFLFKRRKSINVNYLSLMIDLYYQGGPLFMGILTLILLVLVATAIFMAVKITPRQKDEPNSYNYYLQLLRQIGLIALIIGILGQLIGLYQAFDSIQAAGMISPAILAGGLKVSMITTLYGFFIYLLSILIWLVFSLKKQPK